jgi:glycosyltransferase involved in cell wall biosynthesis
MKQSNISPQPLIITGVKVHSNGQRSAAPESGKKVAGQMPMVKILEIGNYPPPMCGWAIQTKLLTEELRRRGQVCQVLNINESRKRRSPEYVDVQNSFDYAYKLIRFALAGYRFHMHVNGESKKGYLLALAAVLVGRLFGRPAVLTFHGGLPQTYFPRPESSLVRWAFKLLFHLSGRVTCDSPEIKQAIERYGITPERIAAIPCFSAELLDFRHVELEKEIESFLSSHHPVFFCFVCFRPEYRLPVLREAMARFRQRYPYAGFIWLGFPAKERTLAKAFLRDWLTEEAESLLVLGNLTHDEFLTLLRRCDASIRTPACDGISAFVLESLALGVPVVASENGRRPPRVVTYRECDAGDLVAKLTHVIEHYVAVKSQTRLEGAENNTKLAADWLMGERNPATTKEPEHAS